MIVVIHYWQLFEVVFPLPVIQHNEHQLYEEHIIATCSIQYICEKVLVSFSVMNKNHPGQVESKYIFIPRRQDEICRRC